MLINIQRNPLGVEDMTFGLGTETQTRDGNSVTVTQINASSIPVDESTNLQEAWEAVDDFQTYFDTYGDGITNLSDNLTAILAAHQDLVDNGWSTVDLIVADAVLFGGETKTQVLDAAEDQTAIALDIKYHAGSGEIRQYDDTVISINAGTLGGSNLTAVLDAAEAQTSASLDIKYDSASGEIRQDDDTEIAVDAATLDGLTRQQLSNTSTGLKFSKLIDTSHSMPAEWMIGLTSDGLLVHWGRETDYVAGTSNETGDSDGLNLVQQPIDQDGTAVTKIIASPTAWMILYDNGNLYSIGDGGSGQLGQGNTTDYDHLRLVKTNIADMVTASAGDNSNFSSWLAIDTSGNLWAWGENGAGQLGDGTTTDILTPTQVSISGLNVGETISKAYVVGSTNRCSTYVVTSEGRVFSCGWNGDGGALGLGDTVDRTSFELVAGSLAAKTVSKLIPAGGAGVGSNRHSVIAFTSDNLLYAWGYGGNGELGQGSTTSYSSPQAISATPTSGSWSDVVGSKGGDASFFAISSGGELWGWGANNHGCLGLGDTAPKTSLTQVTILNDDATQNTSGVSEVHFCVGHTNSTRCTALIITNDNKLFTSGYNSNGQLGNNDTSDVDEFTEIRIHDVQNISQVSSGGASTETFWNILYTDGRVVGWGDNNYQQVYNGQSRNYCPVPQLTHM